MWNFEGGDSGVGVKGWVQLCSKKVTVKLIMVFREVCSQVFAVMVVRICL